MTKKEIQDKTVELSRSYGNLLITWATGCGKSKAALDVINLHKGKGYIVVAETSHINNWINEFKAFGYEHLLDKIEIFCYHSLHKYTDIELDFLILDEVHHIFTDIRLDLLSKIKSKRVIGLSATLSLEEKKQFRVLFGDYKEYHIPLSKAINSGLLPKPKIFLIPIDLDDLTVNNTFSIVKGVESKRKITSCLYEDKNKYIFKYKHLDLTVHCTERQKYNIITEYMDSYRDKFFKLDAERIEKDLPESYTNWAKFKWLNYGSIRKRFIADSKDKYVKILLDKLRNKRTIIFTGSVEQSKRLSPKKEHIINSYKTKKTNADTIEKFNNKEIDKLFATGMLREGMNLTDIQASIIVQLSNQLRDYIQRLGRVLRSRVPEQYIIYARNTQDEKYLETAMKGMDTQYLYKINDLNELK